MDEASEWINTWIAFSAEARQRLAITHEREIQHGEFTEAVRELWKAESQLMMLYTPIPTVDEIVEQLNDYPFEPLGECLQTITLLESVLPKDFLDLSLEQQVKQDGEKWEIHKYDADPFPSNPHAHNYESNVKLHLGTGELFRKKDFVGRVKCKDLLQLRERIKGLNLPPYACS